MAARHHHKKVHGEHYSGHEERRKQEREDAGMIHEDHNAVANLPQEVMMKMYPNADYGMPEELDDTIRGIDRQMDKDDSKRKEHFAPKKV